MLPLFQAYPRLKAKLPYVSLAELPTPVHKLHKLEKSLNAEQLYIKRDDLSGLIYGGNKIRKLEFLLGDVLNQKSKRVLTFGFAGSNHALATAIYAHSLGIRTTSMLMPQMNAQYVRRNLLMSHYYEADIHQHQTQLTLLINTAYQLLHYTLKEGRIPYIIAPGGSSPLGAIAYVNAAFELKEQILQGHIPEPDFIYLPLGTMGTAVGLVLGLKAVGLKTKVIAVLVVEAQFANEKKMVKLFNHTNSLLHSLDSTFPILKMTENDVLIRQEFFGEEYARFTKLGMKAITQMDNQENIQLDGTYTGKAFAALIHDINQEDIKDQVILFWNTYNSRSLPFAGEDFHQLPQSFHHYFVDKVQPLDQEELLVTLKEVNFSD
ncbi:pyridoxal-phosphate dependent enzyme [Nostoc sp. FACHB-152]|uniref:1-aminocyclopropane-1-carboxylate deaminase/D-cysteine desulfhydrase n=1 Tax=unclassified Nostoc TaxID=2593658 RepID=UPI00168241A5|nr:MULTISPECIES: pyridoxal-phosphate dependent enzyme [unclassified Nostoc]MBD2452031.1 pyridoxal-phosphate dependent enzyme [Nostoc sp. FACHB-152]MBD2469854.1 pyridoxal-phosphate dependent enzyme [Nostoc sp. FACHB-145]